MRVTLRRIACIGLTSVCCGFLSAQSRADVIFSVTDLGPASPTVSASGGFGHWDGQALVPSNGNYLPALSASQQAAFQSGSFDPYAHPATADISNLGFFGSEHGAGFDVFQATGDELSNFAMTTSNNQGVTVGTADESLPAESWGHRLVEFTPDPHTVDLQAYGLPSVHSPGYVYTIWTQSTVNLNTFWGTPTGINDHNNIVFNQYNFSDGPWTVAPHALIGSAEIALGTLGGANAAAYALNNSNEVVGWSQIANGDSHAFLYANGTMEDLNLLIAPLSGITLTSAVGIDAAGEIVAYGTDASGQSHEYLLTPAEAPVPEPSTLAVMGLMIIAMAARQARARSATR